MPGPDGAVTSTPAEVDTWWRLVVEHAVTRPDECAGRGSARPPTHADRVREAVLAEVRANPALGRFFDPLAREPFVVVDLGSTEALRRDAVVLSVGFGRTPHGRVLHRFGAARRTGRGCASARGAGGGPPTAAPWCPASVPHDLDPERLGAPGPALLRDLLASAAEPDATGSGTRAHPMVRTASCSTSPNGSGGWG